MTAEDRGAGDGDEVVRFWEAHYGRHERVWSGRPNAVLVDIAGPLAAGRALDLGCGEGGDAVWLAGRGWHVTAVDVSVTALERAAAQATAAGVESRIHFQQHDLGRSFPAGTFDLVSAQYLQSPVALPRDHVLRRAAGAVAAGGLLLVVEHGSVPSWARKPDSHARFPTPERALATLELELGAWETERLGAPERQSTGPDGQLGTIRDTVIALRRRAG
ncbi:MAG: Thioredoxin reductase [uncultured Solirubrobacteraceae bacterium]|uniref:Thioredoxin reductase n=1 Tax=uncultured Solirubrobacteraceae bacterium TaxID=1162706 RepID=A0A6J4SD99_9ACTN|nr:MAG: Thioredoxin reductase [uncultured Solirubrobacteraceae bacterium]